MLPPRNTISARLRALFAWLMTPIIPKNLRLFSLMVAIYQLIVSHVLLFVVLLALAHAEQMKNLLEIDIEDQKDNGFYDMIPFRNQYRLHTASQLISLTEMLLYILTGTAAVYVLSTIGLFMGISRQRSEFMLPWLITEVIFIASAAALMIWLQNERFVEMLGGKIIYFGALCSFLIFDSFMWYIVQCHYHSVRAMNKLTEIATVAIPCPGPGGAPYHYRRENMYLGSNGYKHILTDADNDGTY